MAFNLDELRRQLKEDYRKRFARHVPSDVQEKIWNEGREVAFSKNCMTEATFEYNGDLYLVEADGWNGTVQRFEKIDRIPHDHIPFCYWPDRADYTPLSSLKDKWLK